MEADRQVPPSPSTRKRHKATHEAIIASAATLLLQVKAPTAARIDQITQTVLATEQEGRKSTPLSGNPLCLHSQETTVGKGSGIIHPHPPLNPRTQMPGPPLCAPGIDIVLVPPRAQGIPAPPCIADRLRTAAPQEVVTAAASRAYPTSHSAGNLPVQLSPLVLTPELDGRTKEVVARATERAAHLYLQQRHLAAQEDRVCPYGTLRAAVKRAELEHHLAPGTLNPGTVRARVSRGRLNGVNEATTSPLVEIEDRIFAHCRELQSVGQLHSKEQVIQIAVAVIEATPRLAERLVEWKKKYSHHEDGQALVGDGWYRGFRQRHKFQLKRSGGRKKGRAAG